MARTYATEADYQEWTGDTGATVSDALLARASLTIDTALIGSRYPVDDVTKLPTETAHIEALRDAVCAQVQWWDETGDTTGTGAADRFQSASIGSANYTRGYNGQGSAAGNSARIAPTAADVLRVAGFTVDVCVHG